MSENLKRTQLYDWHVSHGDVVPFAGWEMPVRYSSIREEHMAVRDSVGIFDTSHMSRFFIRGPQATEFLQTISTNNVRKLGINSGQYSTCLNERGGVRDDLMLYRIGENEFIWVTNAANGPKILSHMIEHSKEFDVKIEDRSNEITMIAVQGPHALDTLSKVAGRDFSEYKRFTCNRVDIAGFDCYLCRTGYTGEDGAEVLVLDTPLTDEGKGRAVSFWERLLKDGDEFGIKPCGLGARDSTRLEAGFVLYGHELNEDTTPIEAGIPYAVKLKVDPHYIGYDVVFQQKKEGPPKTRIGLEMIDRGIPREKYGIILNGERIGEVTSGGMSPISNKGIALGYVPSGTVSEGDTLHIDIKGRFRRALVKKWPFYDPSKYGSARTS
ncbi:MAG: glycine cleavage system aminomethyltransferase GcvT [Candidatus Thorarchaeota archaeon]|nr:MAG: glycine cleavage system aminomethyltransferase GcvT [Candidatus Thorarchaeota archaeon]